MPTQTRQGSPNGATQPRLEDLTTLQHEINKGTGVKNAVQAKQYLNKIGWLDHAEKPSPTQLTAFLLTAVKNAKQHDITDIVRSVAYILDNTIVETIATNITDKVEAKLRDATEEMKKEINELSARNITLIAEQSAEHNNTASNSQSLEAKIDTAIEQIKTISESQKTLTTASQLTYSNVVKGIRKNEDVSSANPTALRILNKIRIQSRQILISFGAESTNIPKDSTAETINKYKGKITEIIANLPNPPDSELSIQNLSITRQGQLLVELQSVETANWLRKPDVMEQLLKGVDPLAHYKPRSYPVILKFVPVTFDIEDKASLRELELSTGCKPDSFIAAKWIKDIPKRHSNQKNAHAKLLCATAETANHLITSTVRVENKVIMVKRDIWEPAACNKCQHYGHFAASCTAQKDTCGKCGQEHRTSECTVTEATKCTPCGSTSHATNSNRCPEYIKRLKSVQEKAPENLRMLYPTESNWMCNDGAAAPQFSQPTGSGIDIDKILQEKQTSPQKRKNANTVQWSAPGPSRYQPRSIRGSPRKKKFYHQTQLGFMPANPNFFPPPQTFSQPPPHTFSQPSLNNPVTPPSFLNAPTTPDNQWDTRPTSNGQSSSQPNLFPSQL
jgi:hypothetical protein